MSFPTTLPTTTTIPVETSTTPLSTNHVTNHQESQTTVIALATKVGIDGSADVDSIDYQLSGVASGDKAVSKIGTETLTNKTLSTGSKMSLGSDATGDMYYNSGSGTIARIPVGTDNYIMKLNGTTPNWEAETTTVDASTTVKGIVEAATSAEVTAGTATGGTGAVLVVTPDALLTARPPTEIQTFTTAGTASWTKSSNAKWVEVTVIGGGGGGGGGASGLSSGGGGGGALCFKRFNASALGSTESYTVGAGGAGGTGGAAGTAGGFSSFGTTVLIKAGGGGAGGSGSGAGTGGTGNGDIYQSGGAGGLAGAGTDTSSDSSPRGGGGSGANGGAFVTNFVLAGGTSGAPGSAGNAGSSTLVRGGTGGGGGTTSGSNGGAGGTFGAGGGAAAVSGTGTGGTGASGLIVVVTYF
jgi:hypothetical protein